jgi:cysteine synthase A
VNEEHQRRFQSLGYLVGNTPLLEIEFEYKGKSRKIFAKAEHLNMTGSIKDRMALHILKKAVEKKKLEPGHNIVEATSGNTGISFAALGKALGHPVTIFMPDWMSRERTDLIQSLGARIMPVTRDEGGFIGSIEKAEKMACECRECFLPSQFSNHDNIKAHFETTGPELWWQLTYNGYVPDAFIAGVGTGGTIMGVGKFLKSKRGDIKIHPLEPANSPTLSTGRKVGQHRIQGISDEFIPAIVDLDTLDNVISVDDGDAIIMAQKLAAQLGLAVGISSGANFIGALLAQEQLDPSAVVATVFPDDNKKYLSTDLLKDEPPKPDFLSPDIELTGYKTYKRVCTTCCDFEHCTEKNAGQQSTVAKYTDNN